MDRKFQIFVSSTRKDLLNERDAVMKAILEIGHIPVGMEMFSAADEDSWTLIKRQIDQSDYYIVIIAHCYGSTADDGVSYTEKEYDYAVEKEIPSLRFVILEAAPWPGDKREFELEKVAALNRFKEKVDAKQNAFWNDAHDLRAHVLAALPKLINLRQRPGWVRGTSVASPEVLSEMARLSAENAELRRLAQPSVPKLAFHLNEAEVGSGLSGRDLIIMLQATFAIASHDSRPASIPLDFITTIISSGENHVAIQTTRCSGIDAEGKHGTRVQMEVTGPRGAFLYGMAPLPPWLDSSDILNASWTFQVLGFEAKFTINGTLKKDHSNGQTTWRLETVT